MLDPVKDSASTLHTSNGSVNHRDESKIFPNTVQEQLSALSFHSLCSDASQTCPPKIEIIKVESHTRMPWKNGAGETSQVAIFPKTHNFQKDPFIWRLSLAEVVDSCSFSIFPGYDVALMLLPEQDASIPPKGTMSSPAILYHNDQAHPTPLKVLSPYVYRGEWPTACKLNVKELKHLTFISNRHLSSVHVALETVPAHFGEGSCCESNDLGYISAHETNQVPHSSPKRDIKSRILLGHFTILYVLSGELQVEIEGHTHACILKPGETLICEREEDCSPTRMDLKSVGKKPSPERIVPEGENPLEDNDDVQLVVIEVSLIKRERTESSMSSVFGQDGISTPKAQFNVIGHPKTKSGSVIVYDDQPVWNVPPVPPHRFSLSGMISTDSLFGPNLTTKFWESARLYHPPVFSNRYLSESQVPPPIVKDSLVIDDFPVGVISTAWINMVKQGLSEWIRVPVIVARGKEPGPTVGITAVVHGNELNGVPCIHRVISDIDVHSLRGTVVAVPCVNIPGYLRFTREFSDGKDLNRAFPGQEFGTASQIYNYNFFNKIVTHFDYLIDLHTASFGRVNSYYVRSDMNDPVSAVMAELQKPQIILHNSGQDGTLRSAASARGIKAITVEIGNPQLFQNQYVQWSYIGVMRILSYLDMFNSDVPEENPPKTILCSKGFWIYTKTGGVLEVYPPVNTLIRKGALIARIKNIFGNIIDEIYCPSNGIAIGRSSNPVAQAGDRVLHLGIIKKENEILAKEAKENY